jgi:hypothetical protein
MTAPHAELFPTPRELRLGGDPPPPTAAPRFRMDASLPAQGYAIAADRQGIRVDHADAAGRRYAEDTLAQLRRSHGALPGLQLRDAPDFATRGYLLDVSRDRVPTRESLLLLVGRLARLRFNHLELYTEHAFAWLYQRRGGVQARRMGSAERRCEESLHRLDRRALRRSAGRHSQDRRPHFQALARTRFQDGRRR